MIGLSHRIVSPKKACLGALPVLFTIMSPVLSPAAPFLPSVQLTNEDTQILLARVCWPAWAKADGQDPQRQEP